MQQEVASEESLLLGPRQVCLLVVKHTEKLLSANHPIMESSNLLRTDYIENLCLEFVLSCKIFQYNGLDIQSIAGHEMLPPLVITL